MHNFALAGFWMRAFQQPTAKVEVPSPAVLDTPLQHTFPPAKLYDIDSMLGGLKSFIENTRFQASEETESARFSAIKTARQLRGMKAEWDVNLNALSLVTEPARQPLCFQLSKMISCAKDRGVKFSERDLSLFQKGCPDTLRPNI